MSLKKTVEELVKSNIDMDLKSSSLFTKALEEFKGCVSHESTLKGLKNVVTEVGEELQASKAFLTRANNVLTLAGKASEFNLHTLEGKSNVVKLYFYNIEKALNLLDYLRMNKPDEVNKVKNTLNKIKKVADKRVYNDNYAKELKSLYKEHKVELSSDGKVFQLSMSKEGIDKMLDSLKDNQELLEYLSSQIAEMQLPEVA